MAILVFACAQFGSRVENSMAKSCAVRVEESSNYLITRHCPYSWCAYRCYLSVECNGKLQSP